MEAEDELAGGVDGYGFAATQGAAIVPDAHLESPVHVAVDSHSRPTPASTTVGDHAETTASAVVRAGVRNLRCRRLLIAMQFDDPLYVLLQKAGVHLSRNAARRGQNPTLENVALGVGADTVLGGLAGGRLMVPAAVARDDSSEERGAAVGGGLGGCGAAGTAGEAGGALAVRRREVAWQRSAAPRGAEKPGRLPSFVVRLLRNRRVPRMRLTTRRGQHCLTLGRERLSSSTSLRRTACCDARAPEDWVPRHLCTELAFYGRARAGPADRPWDSGYVRRGGRIR